ncbi:S1 family peptidase [Gordonia shandongensis]|uniref:S1 family peptidase n=1 Tax=Gordonia shandongensis TaxID=376351 RepID=UPI0004087D21|nr:S1 family peptidase [Gordonia shandongensis]
MKRIRTAVLALSAAALAMAPAVASAPAEAAPKAAVGGGSGIIVNGKSACTMTAVGRDRAGRLVGLTAAHCGKLGSRVGLERNRRAGQVGRIVTANPKLDYAVVLLDGSRVRPVRTVGKARITRVGTYPKPFSNVCKSGRTTGFSCGPTLTTGGRFVYNYVCSAPGDSGGPIMVGSRLVGMLNGIRRIAGPNTPPVFCVDPAFPVYTPMAATPIRDVLRNLNGVPAIGAGFRVI